MKIGRNEPCPCGSGLKYKKCCLHKSEEERLAEAISSSLFNIKNDAHIKQCLHPNHDECKGRIIKAHAIQNNRILTRIAERGMVVTTDGVLHHVFQTTDTKGRKVATTFTGFCEYHDKTLFQEIEDKEFENTEKQIFLLTYRTLAWHYHKKQEQAQRESIIVSRMRAKGFDPAQSSDYKDYIKGLSLALEDNEDEKRVFDSDLLEEKYASVRSWVWKIPYEISFAISMMTELEHDILGNPVNDIEHDKKLKKIYLNIFPANGVSYCIWSWLAKNDDVYLPFVRQFQKLAIDDRENYFNNNLPRWSDSLVLSPKLWNNWGEGIQQAFITHANFDTLYRAMERETHDYKYSFQYTPWNLFSNLSEEPCCDNIAQ